MCCSCLGATFKNYNSPSKEQIKEGILFLLDTPSKADDHGESYTFLQVREFLRNNNIIGYFEEDEVSWRRLKDLLREMAEEGLIEEKHFEDHGEKRIGYDIEDKGLDTITQLSRSELEQKWKMP